VKQGLRLAIDAVEGHEVGLHGGGLRQQPHHRQHRHRLSGAGFTDDGQNFSGIDGDVDALNGHERAVGCLERDGEVPDFEK
jgi:hypothetical protein